MNIQFARALAHGALAAVVASGCAGAAHSSATTAAAARSAETPPPPETRPPAAPVAATPSPERRGYAPGDVAFMQHMIGHHAQALTMTALVGERSASQAVRTLAERITVSQRDEIAMMRRWLEARHETVPMEGIMSHAHDMGAMPGMAGMPGMSHDSAAGGEHTLMPGMLTADQLAQLAAARGPAFDRLFLEDMIRHHEGAITMVASLFATPGAGQEPELFRLASDVDADQRAEIARMRTLLASLPAPQ